MLIKISTCVQGDSLFTHKIKYDFSLFVDRYTSIRLNRLKNQLKINNNSKTPLKTLLLTFAECFFGSPEHQKVMRKI